MPRGKASETGKKPAKKKAKQQPAPAPAEAVKPSEVSSMIPATKLNSLLREGRKTDETVRSASGTYGGSVKSAVEKYGLNRSVFAVIRRLDKMEPEKLANWLDHFDYYIDVTGIEKRADQVQRLPNLDPAAGPEEPEADNEAAEAAADKANVRPFPRPAAVADA